MRKLASFAVLLALGYGIYYGLTRTYTFSSRIELPLPTEIGGHLPVAATVAARLHPLDVAASGEVVLELSSADLNLVVPTKDYSLLVDSSEHPRIASMLGRLEFAPESASVAVEGRNLRIAAVMQGEFYVRERREFRKDEEQPTAGKVMPFVAAAAAEFEAVGLDAGWRVAMASRTLRFRLDEETREAWRGEFGEEDEFADYIEGIVNEKGQALLAKLEAGDSSLRTEIEGLLARFQESRDLEMLNRLEVTSIAADNCATPGAQEGSVQFSFAGRAAYRSEEAEAVALPDLEIRPGPCS